MATYANVADWRQRFDEREIAQLVSDDGTAVDLADLNDNTVALDILQDAEGEVLAALLAGGRVTQALLADISEAGESLLKRLICDLATTFLMERRAGYDPEQYAAREKRVQERLKELRSGVNVFGLAVEVAAGKPQLAAPTIAQRQTQGLIRDSVHNYYPAVRLPVRTD